MILRAEVIFRFLICGLLGLAPVLSYGQEDKAKPEKEAPAKEEVAVGGDGEPLSPQLFADSLELEEKKPPKKKKKVYLGHRFKKGYTKKGKGKSRTVEQFGYLKTFKEPKEYLLDKYYYDVKKKKLLRGRQLPEKDLKVLHGPYKKMIGGEVVEEGYFNIGAKHGRWEKYNNKNILLAKDYFDNGLPRDAEVSFYDPARTKLKQVIPWEYGEKTGQYLEFYDNGQLHWEGWYENGRRVGVWTEYYDFRNRRHYQYQYPESAFDEEHEPFLIREYDRNGNTVYELKEPGRRQPVRARQ